MSGNIFGCHHVRGEDAVHLVGRGQGCCYSAYSARDGPPQQRIMQPHMAVVLRCRNPGIMYQFMTGAVIPSSHPLICSSLADYTSLCLQISQSSARILLFKPQQAMRLDCLNTVVGSLGLTEGMGSCVCFTSPKARSCAHSGLSIAVLQGNILPPMLDVAVHGRASPYLPSLALVHILRCLSYHPTYSFGILGPDFLECPSSSFTNSPSFFETRSPVPCRVRVKHSSVLAAILLLPAAPARALLCLFLPISLPYGGDCRGIPCSSSHWSLGTSNLAQCWTHRGG